MTSIKAFPKIRVLRQAGKQRYVLVFLSYEMPFSGVFRSYKVVLIVQYLVL